MPTLLNIFTISNCITFFIILFSIQFIFGQNNEDIVTGEKIKVYSGILKEDRICLISLPDSYNDSSKIKNKYPIMILLDGSTHFKTASGIVHFMSSNRNRNYFMPETIIVAIENVDCERDFTVTKIKEVKLTVDGNHPLACKTAKFSVKVIEVRDATAIEFSEGMSNPDISVH